ncbi:MAG: hypothetical protein WCG80_17825 [Spirochaetales bacterium]
MTEGLWIALVTGGCTLGGIALSGLFRLGELRRQVKREQLDKAMENLSFFYDYEDVVLSELASATGRNTQTLKIELRKRAGGDDASRKLFKRNEVRRYLVERRLLVASEKDAEEIE